MHFVHIKAHDASYWNDAADATAKAAAIGVIDSCLPLLLGREWFKSGSALVEWLWCAVATPEYRISFGLPGDPAAIITLPQQRSLSVDELAAVICKPDLPVANPLAMLGIRLATLNARKKLDDVPRARQKPTSGFLPYLRGQVQDRRIHILGIQEAHSSEQGLFASGTHIRACSGPHGDAKTGDVEIWFSTDKPWVKDECRAPTVDDLGLMHAEQKVFGGQVGVATHRAGCVLFSCAHAFPAIRYRQGGTAGTSGFLPAPAQRLGSAEGLEAFVIGG